MPLVTPAAPGLGVIIDYGTNPIIAYGEQRVVGNTPRVLAAVAAGELTVVDASQNDANAPTSTAGGSGTHANRPASAALGFIYNETDTGLAYYWTGAAWQTVKPGQELGYAETTSNFAQVASANTDYDVTGVTTTVTVGARPILVEAFANAITHSVAASVVQLKLWEDGVQIQPSNVPLVTAGQGGHGIVRVRRNPAAGSHTYKLTARSPTAGTITLIAASTGPVSISVVER